MDSSTPPRIFLMSWYKSGLKFKCTGCGNCCTGFPGTVWVTEQELEAIAEHLQIPYEECRRRYTRLIYGRTSLTEKGRKWDCVFLDAQRRCSIYAVRPTQCRTFPWWKELLTSPEEWEAAAERCEGINHPDAPLISEQEINKHL